jgi:hypothetical protein
MTAVIPGMNASATSVFRSPFLRGPRIDVSWPLGADEACLERPDAGRHADGHGSCAREPVADHRQLRGPEDCEERDPASSNKKTGAFARARLSGS